MFRIENAQSLLGLVVIIALCWAASENRRVFPWRLAGGALLIQLLLVLGLFGLPPLRAVVAALGQGVEALAAATQTGVAFVFGFLAGGEGQPYAVANSGALFVFAFRVLPVILVVCALAALLWHWGVLKAVTRAFGFVFEKTMGLRG
ncbi:MAG: Na+ dependent nucleoside transporter N-terminal domain-containing protein, partial [Phenylobacterium sp.]